MSGKHQTSLWKSPSGRYEIARHPCGKVMVIDNDRGVNDWPIDYGYSTLFTARIAYDHPEWWPKYVKRAVERIMTR